MYTYTHTHTQVFLSFYEAVCPIVSNITHKHSIHFYEEVCLIVLYPVCVCLIVLYPRSFICCGL